MELNILFRHILHVLENLNTIVLITEQLHFPIPVLYDNHGIGIFYLENFPGYRSKRIMYEDVMYVMYEDVKVQPETARVYLLSVHPFPYITYRFKA